MSSKLDQEALEKFKEARAMIKAVYDEKVATVNGNDYKFLSTTHDKRLKVFGYMSSISSKMEKKDFSFLGTKEWKEIERIIQNMITYDGSLLSKIPNHWDEEKGFTKDYINLMMTAMQVISYPLS